MSDYRLLLLQRGDEAVIRVPKTYGVFYDGEPINLRRMNNFHPNTASPFRYRRTSHTVVGQSIALRDTLNQQYKTTRFEVYELVRGDLIDAIPRRRSARRESLLPIIERVRTPEESHAIAMKLQAITKGFQALGPARAVKVRKHK